MSSKRKLKDSIVPLGFLTSTTDGFVTIEVSKPPLDGHTNCCSQSCTSKITRRWRQQREYFDEERIFYQIIDDRIAWQANWAIWFVSFTNDENTEFTLLREIIKQSLDRVYNLCQCAQISLQGLKFNSLVIGQNSHRSIRTHRKNTQQIRQAIQIKISNLYIAIRQ